MEETKSPIGTGTARIIILLVLGILLLEVGLRMAGALLTHSPGTIALDGDSDIVILCLGESTTADGGKDSWPSLLQRELRDRQPNQSINVINGGIVATNTAIILSLLEDNLNTYQPDIVVAMMGDNDEVLAVEFTQPEQGFFQSLKVVRLLSNIGDALSSGIQTSRPLSPPEPTVADKFVARGWAAYTGRQPDSQQDQQHDAEMLEYAEELFLQALELDPAMGDAYRGLGWVYMDKGINRDNNPEMFRMAEEHFLTAFYLGIENEQPLGFTVYEGLGWAYEMRGMRASAIAVYESYLEQPDNPLIDDALNPWMYAELGRLYSETGRSEGEIEQFYAEHNVAFTPSSSTQDITSIHYQKMYRMLDTRGVQLVAVQYPTREVSELEALFTGEENIIFVSNQENFEQALSEESYDDYFLDRFEGTFGHATREGNRLIAESVADAIIGEMQ